MWFSVNEIFNPGKVDEMFSLSPYIRSQAIHRNKDTNYGVVRLELLERLYEHLYAQRLRDPNEDNWVHNIIPLTDITNVHRNGSTSKLTVTLQNVQTRVETIEEFDAIIVATGYVRNVHETILNNTKDLLKKDTAGRESWSVGRDYKLQYEKEKIAANAGVWLQGCCEVTHGVSCYPELPIPFSCYHQCRSKTNI